MSTIINVCHKCRMIPSIKVKSNGVEKTCICTTNIGSFDGYIKFAEWQVEQFNWLCFCATSLYKFTHLFYPVRGFCLICKCWLCEYCIDEHKKNIIILFILFL